MNPTVALIRRERRTANEVRRATVLSDPVYRNFDTVNVRDRVWVVDVDIQSNRVIRNVIVVSQTGAGNLDYARKGQPVLIQRSIGGRWMVVGPADRTSTTGTRQVLDESANTSAAGAGVGFESRTRPFSHFDPNFGTGSEATPGTSTWGTAAFGGTFIVDADGNQVF